MPSRYNFPAASGLRKKAFLGGRRLPFAKRPAGRAGPVFVNKLWLLLQSRPYMWYNTL